MYKIQQESIKMIINEIIDDLRSRIVRGEYAPGSQLERRAELLKQCGASNVTVQRAISQLRKEGFLESRGSKGMYVVNNPPHTSRFALVLPPRRQHGQENNDPRWNALEIAADELVQKFPTYHIEQYLIDSNGGNKQFEYQRLLNDLKLGRLAGTLLPTPFPRELMEPLSHYPLILQEPLYENIVPAVIYLYDYNAMTELAADILLARGCRRIALLISSETNPMLVSQLERTWLRRSPETRPEWFQGLYIELRQMRWNARIIKLMFSPNNASVPDGLIVLNEKSTPDIVEALHGMGFFPGENIHIVAHRNLPFVTPRLDKIDYVAFNNSQLLQNGVEAITRYRTLNLEKERLIAPEYVPAGGLPILKSIPVTRS